MNIRTRTLLGAAAAGAIGLGALTAGAGAAGAAPGATPQICSQGADLVVFGGNQSGQYPNIDQRVPGVGYALANLPAGATDWTGTLQRRDVVTGKSGSAGPVAQPWIGTNTIQFSQLRTGPGIKAVTITVKGPEGQTLSCSGRLVVT